MLEMFLGIGLLMAVGLLAAGAYEKFFLKDVVVEPEAVNTATQKEQNKVQQEMKEKLQEGNKKDITNKTITAGESRQKEVLIRK